MLAVTESIAKEALLAPDDSSGHYDPHVWMDPEAWSKCVDAVVAKLSDYDPENADFYTKNAKSYKKLLAELTIYGRRSLATVPVESRLMLTSHDAFNYFGRAFNLEVQGVQGLSTESEAGLRRVNELVDLIVGKNVQSVFVESSVPKKSIEALINGARSRGHEVSIGGTLFSDAMGSADSYEGTYVGMIDHNITTVTRALGGNAPAAGFQGKLGENSSAEAGESL